MLLILAALAQAVTALAALDLRWLLPLETPPVAAAAYDATSAYVPLRDGSLVAVDLERGTVRWRREAAMTIAPSAGGGMVFAAGEGLIRALDATTGAIRWQTPLPGQLASITWDTGWLLCATDAGDLAALRASDGGLMWTAPLGGPLAVPPAAGLDRVYVGLDQGRIVSLALVSGARGWEQTVPGRITGLRAVEGQLVAGTTGRAIFSLDLETGRQRWRWRVGGDVSGAASSDGNLLFFAARDNVLRAVDVRSGNLRWSAELPARPLGGPQVFAGTVLVPLASTVATFDAATGKSSGALNASGELSTPPHLRDGRPMGARLVALTRDGRLQGFGVRVEEPPVALTLPLPGQSVVPEP
jgi:eukaryotic-like serine/threonine-protein kinase